MAEKMLRQAKAGVGRPVKSSELRVKSWGKVVGRRETDKEDFVQPVGRSDADGTNLASRVRGAEPAKADVFFP